MSFFVNSHRFGGSFVRSLPGIHAWFDTSLGDPNGYITTGGGSNVTQINDLSGNGNHATKFSTSNTATVGVNINGKTALGVGRPIGYTFTGVSHDLFTLVTVCNPNGTGILIGQTGGGTGTFGYESDGKLTGECRTGAFNRQPSHGGLNVANCDAMTHDGTTVKIYSFDSVTPTQSNTAGTLAGGTFNDIGYGAIASNLGFSGTYGEIVICSSVLSAGNLTAVMSYLIAKWGVT